VELGAYVRGANPALDEALSLEPTLCAWLRQDAGGVPRAHAIAQLTRALQRKETP
jgi:flagellum-specific ATP synthase